MNQDLQSLIAILEESFQNNTFCKATISKPADKNSDLVTIYLKPVEIKNNKLIAFNYRYKTNDQFKNFTLNETKQELSQLLSETFKEIHLFETSFEHTLQISKKGKSHLSCKKLNNKLDIKTEHNKEKHTLVSADTKFLKELGVSNEKGLVIPTMADKYRQINKYLEIIENQIKNINFSNNVHIVDMGSGKGYLTFALYDYLKNIKGLDVSVTGIELRKDLVDFCNKAAQNCGFQNLNFVCQSIQDYLPEKIDILIALHACDTATDDALYKAIVSKSQLIVCAPCCHKQLRQQSKGKEQESPLLKYGIFKERHFEMLTDTMRAIILENEGYETNIFEFISNEHTRKNIMLVASKKNKTKQQAKKNEQLENLKKQYQIDFHYLEKLLANS